MSEDPQVTTTNSNEPDPSKSLTIYFDDPRLKMTWPGRSLVRTVSYVTYLVLIAATFGFLISRLRILEGAGALLILFLGDRLLHRGEGDRPLSELSGGNPINVADSLSPTAYGVLERAFDRSALRHEYFPLALTHELLSRPEVLEGLRRLDVKVDEFKAKTEAFLGESTTDQSFDYEKLEVFISTATLKAFRQALAESHDFVEVTDLFAGLPLLEDSYISRLFNMFAIEAGDLERALTFGWMQRRPLSSIKLPEGLGGIRLEAHRRQPHRIMNRAWTARPTPTLDKYAIDYTDLARTGEVGFLVGHTEEYDRLVDALSRPINPNAILVGEAGIGKQTVVARFALSLTKDKVPAALFDKRLVELQLSSLVAGAAPEELQKRLQTIVEEINLAGNIILFIPDIHNLVRTSGTAFLSAADAILPVIKDNGFPVIGSTYPREFKEDLEARTDFTSLFEIIRMKEITAEEAEKILVYESLILERRTKEVISFGAIKEASKLGKKYFGEKFLPSSASELLKGALVEAQRLGEKVVGPERVIHVAEEKVNIPIHKASEEEAQTLLHLEDTIHENYIDQEEAVHAVANSLREYRAGITRPGGPIASFLFVGPTGVGKTELAKIVAKVQFGSEQSMIRFDMTEYQDKQSFYRFIGSPDGSVSGALTEAILHKPYCLILLDEFEKAFPDILNLFLQVLDDGRLTDNLGRTVDFQNTVIIATSNAHSDIINESLAKGEKVEAIAEYLKTRLVDVFKPELLNRFSKVVIFHDLAPKDLAKVVEFNLKDLAKLADSQGIKLTFDPAVISRIASIGYDPKFGARPLRRVIDDKLRSPLADEILKQAVKRGSEVKVVLEGETFKFEVVRAAGEA